MTGRPTYLVTRTMSLLVVLAPEDITDQEEVGETDHDTVRIIADNTPWDAWDVSDQEITP